MNPTEYNIVVRVNANASYDLTTNRKGELLTSRSMALAALRELVEEGFDPQDLTLLPIYNGPIFTPEYSTNHQESFL